MQIFARGNDVVGSTVASYDLALPLQGSLYKCRSTLVALVRKLYLVHRPCRSTRVDEYITISLYEPIPLKIKWEALSDSYQRLLAFRHQPSQTTGESGPMYQRYRHTMLSVGRPEYQHIGRTGSWPVGSSLVCGPRIVASGSAH